MICQPAPCACGGRRPSPLGEVGAGAVEWTSERLQQLINDFNVMGNRWTALQRVFEELYAQGATGGNPVIPATWAPYIQYANGFYHAVRRRRDWIYELAYYTGTNRWEPQGAVINDMIRRAQEAGLVSQEGLSGLPLAAGVVGVLAGLVAWLRWCGLKTAELEQTAAADIRRLDQVNKVLAIAQDPRQPAEVREGALAMAGDGYEAIAARTPDLGTKTSAGSDFVLPLALVALLAFGGARLLGGGTRR